jgi:uncharacterized protein YraI
LANMIAAKKLGQPGAAAAAETQAASVTNPNVPAGPGAPVIAGQ